METEKLGVFEFAMLQLDKIASQLDRGMINKNDFDQQRLIILIDLVISHQELIKERESK